MPSPGREGGGQPGWAKAEASANEAGVGSRTDQPHNPPPVLLLRGVLTRRGDLGVRQGRPSRGDPAACSPVVTCSLAEVAGSRPRSTCSNGSVPLGRSCPCR